MPFSLGESHSVKKNRRHALSLKGLLFMHPVDSKNEVIFSINIYETFMAIYAHSRSAAGNEEEIGFNIITMRSALPLLPLHWIIDNVLTVRC